jgi:hypothetical protein
MTEKITKIDDNTIEIEETKITKRELKKEGLEKAKAFHQREIERIGGEIDKIDRYLQEFNVEEK